jgi:adenosylmethionine-8-amino-7-oxononanoate aminotransferase
VRFSFWLFGVIVLVLKQIWYFRGGNRMNPEQARALLDADRAHVWHPFTQMKDYWTEDHLLIERANGVFVYDASGNEYYDTNSSWWVNLHGHCHPRIRAAINRQLEMMDHVMFSGLTHPNGIQLAQKLVAIAPPGLSRVFYSDNGSTAVEVALKMSFQYWRNQNRSEKASFIYMDNAYHGDTIGAVSVGGVDLFHGVFKPLLFPAHKVMSPSEPELVDAALANLEATLQTHGHTIAAMIIEPLVQAAGGMVIYPPAYLKRARELCSAYAVHLIADEVATGFGRTGKLFACEYAGVTPDMLCLSKGLTAGIMPLSVTMCTDEIYQAFFDDYETLKTFFHGHSFTGNPLACAVALESLAIFEDTNLLQQVEQVSQTLQSTFSTLTAHPHVTNIRGIGMIAALDLVQDRRSGAAFPFTDRVGFQVYKQGLKHGLLLRPLGDTLYVWLPLITTEQQIVEIVARIDRVLTELSL